jgi:hypothetical protein
MRSGIYTAEMGQPPVDIDGASAGMDDKPVKKKPAAKPAYGIQEACHGIQEACSGIEEAYGIHQDAGQEVRQGWLN